MAKLRVLSGKAVCSVLSAIEVYRKQILPLREEENTLKDKIRKMELRLVEKEKSEEYKKILTSIVEHVDTIKAGLDISGKKGLLKLVFKKIIADNGRLKNFELYEPFKSLYEGLDPDYS